MNLSDNIQNELKEIAPFLAKMEKTNIFSVPENYFSNLNSQVVKKINDEELQILPDVPMPLLNVPGDYFNNLAGNILQKIKSLNVEDSREELEEISPTLYAAKNENIFKVPEGYFENLPETILSLAKQSPAKVVVMKKRSMVWQCAAAAVFTGFMAISALWVTNNSSSLQPTLAATEKTIPADVKDALQYKNEEQINEGIANLSDADIIKYLELTGSSADDNELAAGIPEKELPDEKDYLNDENTLQIFLNETETKISQN